MIIPTIANIKVSNPDGTMHKQMRDFLVQLISPLQKNLSDEGYSIPSLSQEQINQISGENSKQRLIYNSTTGKMMLNNNGNFQTINVT